MAEIVAVIKKILVGNIMQLFEERDKIGARRSFVAVIRQNGFKVVQPRDLKCCDIVLFETRLAQYETVCLKIVQKCVDEYINYERRLYT